MQNYCMLQAMKRVEVGRLQQWGCGPSSKHAFESTLCTLDLTMGRLEETLHTCGAMITSL